jgi:hypothetical protein
VVGHLQTGQDSPVSLSESPNAVFEPTEHNSVSTDQPVPL